MARSASPTLVLIALLAATLSLASTGCNEVRQAMSELEGAAIVAPTKPEMRTDNVIPSADPVEMLPVVVDGERTLSHLANGLGATVDDIMIDNQLADSRVKSGTELTVRTTRSRLNRYVERRERRRQLKAERARTKKAARLNKRKRPHKKARRKTRRAHSKRSSKKK